MLNRQVKNKFAVYLPFIIVFLFCLDSAVTVLSYYNFPFYRVSLPFRGLLFFLCILLLLKNLNRKVVREDVFLIFLLLCCFIVSIPYILIQGDASTVLVNFMIFFKFVYFIVVLSIGSLLLCRVTVTNKVKKAYEAIILISSLVIIMGAFFDMDIFKSYGSSRFGYKGLIYAVNEVGLFFVLAYLYLLAEYASKRKHYLLFILVFLAVILTGSKAAIGSVVFATLLFVVRMKPRLIIYFLLAMILFVSFLIHLWNMNSEIFDWIRFSMSRSDLLTVIVSGRDAYIYDRFMPLISNWGILNYIFGGGDLSKYATEMDFLDLFTMLGFFGSSIYLLFIVKKTVVIKSGMSTVIILTVLLYAFFAGHVFYSAINATYFAILIASLKMEGKFVQNSQLFDNLFLKHSEIK